MSAGCRAEITPWAYWTGRPCRAIKIETEREFYDYQAKYLDDGTRYLCPCGLPQELEAELADLALRAFAAIGAGGWGRVDMLLDKNQKPSLIDVNTVPGMTGHSLVPMAAKRTGLDFDDLALRVLDTSLPAPAAAGRELIMAQSWIETDTGFRAAAAPPPAHWQRYLIKALAIAATIALAA